VVAVDDRAVADPGSSFSLRHPLGVGPAAPTVRVMSYRPDEFGNGGASMPGAAVRKPRSSRNGQGRDRGMAEFASGVSHDNTFRPGGLREETRRGPLHRTSCPMAQKTGVGEVPSGSASDRGHDARARRLDNVSEWLIRWPRRSYLMGVLVLLARPVAYPDLRYSIDPDHTQVLEVG